MGHAGRRSGVGAYPLLEVRFNGLTEDLPAAWEEFVEFGPEVVNP